MKTFDGTYLKKYYYFAFILFAACVICMTLVGIFAFTKDTWSYGIIVLLALSLVLAVLAIISWVALYREEGRHRERRFPKEPQIELEKEIKSLQEAKRDLECEKSKLEEDKATLEKEKEKLIRKALGDEYEKFKTKLIEDFVKKIDEGYGIIIEDCNKKRIGWQNEITTKLNSFLESEPKAKSPKEDPSITEENPDKP